MGLRLGHEALLFSMKNHRKYALAFRTGVAIAHRGELLRTDTFGNLLHLLINFAEIVG